MKCKNCSDNKGIIYSILLYSFSFLFACNTLSEKDNADATVQTNMDSITFDNAAVPNTPFGKAVLYGRKLMLSTPRYIGTKGSKGRYLGNVMSCSNCHQNGGMKPNAFSLVLSHQAYPQYRAREAKILSLADRVNNCITRPMNGKPLPYDSEEMLAFLSYFRYINERWGNDSLFRKKSIFALQLTNERASSERGAQLYAINCSRCHGNEGQGVLNTQKDSYLYPPLWGSSSYQRGSSMHRIIKMAGWLKLNMPYDKVAYGGNPILTDQEAFDLAAFINNDAIHPRPASSDKKQYPDILTKPIDCEHGPYIDSFSEVQHKFGPYPPIIQHVEQKQIKANY